MGAMISAKAADVPDRLSGRQVTVGDQEAKKVTHPTEVARKREQIVSNNNN